MSTFDQRRREYRSVTAPPGLYQRARLRFESAHRVVAKGPVFALAMALLIAVALVPLVERPVDALPNLSLASLDSPSPGSLSPWGVPQASNVTTPEPPELSPSMAMLVTPSFGPLDSFNVEKVN